MAAECSRSAGFASPPGVYSLSALRDAAQRGQAARVHGHTAQLHPAVAVGDFPSAAWTAARIAAPAADGGGPSPQVQFQPVHVVPRHARVGTSELPIHGLPPTAAPERPGFGVLGIPFLSAGETVREVETVHSRLAPWI